MVLPDATFQTINELCSQVGSVGIESPLYRSSSALAPHLQGINGQGTNGQGMQGMQGTKKSRSFQPTKMVVNRGFQGEMDQLRSHLNKLTDKTYMSLIGQIADHILSVCQTCSQTEVETMGTILYECCSTNKFYSKVFADLFASLASHPQFSSWLRPIFDHKLATLPTLYDDMVYVDSNVDYDGFCDMNKANERRKSVTTFMLNLSENGFIDKHVLYLLLVHLLKTIEQFIEQPDKKNQVDELTENVCILFDKCINHDSLSTNKSNEKEEQRKGKEDNSDSSDSEDDDDLSLDQIRLTNKEETNKKETNTEETNKETKCASKSKDDWIALVHHLARSKAKDYPSLSNKSIFKFMDLIHL